MKVEQSGEGRLSIVPETEFEMEFLANMFFAVESRNVVVKSGNSISDVISVDVVVSKVKCPITIPVPEEKLCGCSGESNPKPCSCAEEEVYYAPNSLKNLVKQG